MLNRYYYQTRIPIKDALILSKSEDPAFRRMWIRRIRDHDGDAAAKAGSSCGCGSPTAWASTARRSRAAARVLPGVRFACDAYVELVRERTLLEAVASSLTEFFSPDLMSKRDRWPGRSTTRGSSADDARVLPHAASPRARKRLAGGDRLRGRARHDLRAAGACVAALIRKTEILWHLLDCRHAATSSRLGAARRPRVIDAVDARPQLAPKARLRFDRQAGRYMLLYPERGPGR